MHRRPIVWGIILLLVGGAGWFVSVILSALTGGAFRDVANFCGIVAAASLPVAAAAELILWRIRRRMK